MSCWRFIDPFYLQCKFYEHAHTQCKNIRKESSQIFLCSFIITHHTPPPFPPPPHTITATHTHTHYFLPRRMVDIVPSSKCRKLCSFCGVRTKQPRPHISVRQHATAYRQHTSAYRQHMSAYVSIRQLVCIRWHTWFPYKTAQSSNGISMNPYVSIRQLVCIRWHTWFPYKTAQSSNGISMNPSFFFPLPASASCER